MKSFYPKEGDIKKEWVLVDLKGKTLGRAATKIADVLSGKTKPSYTPSVDVGDYVVAVNADQVRLTGNKLQNKIYYRHTGAIGGIKGTTAKDQMKKDSTAVIYHAVKGMLPKNKLGEHMLAKLKVYKGAEHQHAAQNPKALAI